MEGLTGNLGLPAPAPHKLTYCKSGAPLKKKFRLWRSEAGERGLVAVVLLSSLPVPTPFRPLPCLPHPERTSEKVTTGFWLRLACRNISELPTSTATI